MASTSSQIITNAIASPPVMSDGHVSQGRIRRKLAIVTSGGGAGDEGAGHLFRLFYVSAHDIPLSFRVTTSASFTGAADNNIGVWTPSYTSSDPVTISTDADSAITDNTTLVSAGITHTEWLGLGGTAATRWKAHAGTAFWNLAAIATEPARGTQYEVVVQCVDDPGTVACRMVFDLLYTAGD